MSILLPRRSSMRCAVVGLAAFAYVTIAHAQTYTPVKDLPGGGLVARMRSALSGIGEGGTARDIRWNMIAGELWFDLDGWKTLDLATGAVNAADPSRGGGSPPESATASRAMREGRDRRPPRGRQFTREQSPDGAWTAISENGNLFLERSGDNASGERVQVTKDGTADLKYGQASWVYGEELDQTTAMWWSPDSRFVAFYRFDEAKVGDYYFLSGWTQTKTRLESEAYPKPGEPNPTAEILVHELATGKTVVVERHRAGDAAQAADGNVEYYLYNVRWTPDGSELLYSRTPRRQDVLEVLAADPRTGRSRIVVRETQETWQENRPAMRFLEDGKRFLWETEKTGFKHLELRSLDGSLISTLTAGAWPVESVVLVDEEAEQVWFTAWSAPIAVRQQLHVTRFDGSDAVRVTSVDFHHTDFEISPDRSFVAATAETTTVPRHTVVYKVGGDESGVGANDAAPFARLGEGSTKGFETHELAPSELFTCKAADGITDLYGKIQFPPAFDPARKYPVVVETYGGPSVRLVTDRFDPGDPSTALGFILVTVDNRGTPGRGKAFEGATYLKLGVVDADDQAAAVAHLAATRPYIDGARVGITGHSYGGYMSAIALIRRGDVFAAAVAGAPVTDWRQYDTIYTERYMRTPEENGEGYDAGSCVKHATKLRGKLLLLHGMVDDNVHPNNTFELANALQSQNRPFSMMIFPNSDHGIRSASLESMKWSFFVEALAPAVPEWPSRSSRGEKKADAASDRANPESTEEVR